MTVACTADWLFANYKSTYRVHVCITAFLPANCNYNFRARRCCAKEASDHLGGQLSHLLSIKVQGSNLQGG